MRKGRVLALPSPLHTEKGICKERKKQGWGLEAIQLDTQGNWARILLNVDGKPPQTARSIDDSGNLTLSLPNDS